MNVKLQGRSVHYRTVTFNRPLNEVRLIEQRLLPHEFKIVGTRTYLETASAIRDMMVRGAGAIGATAAFGLAQGAQEFRGKNKKQFLGHVEKVFQTLARARPTAVDPVNAMLGVRSSMEPGASVPEMQTLAHVAADHFANHDVADCENIGRIGEPLIHDQMRVLTHCNAGWLAFVDIGSATAPLYAAHAAGRRIHVFCDETRPRSQGASLTAWELAQQGVSHSVIADNAAGHFMQRGEIDLVIVGADRVLGRTGEVTNKIGTYTKAVLAKRHGIPFYVAIPFSTLDWNLASGLDIPIEERSQDEVLGAWGVPMNPKETIEKQKGPKTLHAANRLYVRVANPTSTARNPAFDVTPPELITGIITPKGIFKPKDLWKNRRLLGYLHPAA